MWKFWDRSEAVGLPESLRLHLIKHRGLTAEAAAALRMMRKRGRYSGRSVTRFVVFDPAATNGPGTEVRHPGDLPPESVLYSGHFERDGQIMLNQAAGT